MLKTPKDLCLTALSKEHALLWRSYAVSSKTPLKEIGRYFRVGIKKGLKYPQCCSPHVYSKKNKQAISGGIF